MTTIQAPSAAPRDGFATVKQGREFIQTCNTTFYALMNDGTIPFVKFRNARRVPWAALHKFVDAAMQAADQDSANAPEVPVAAITPTQRRKQSEAARTELERIGVR